MRLFIRPRSEGVPADLGRPALPGSKSHTQRAMLLAGLAPGAWQIRGAADGADAKALGEALTTLGASVEWGSRGIEIEGRTRPCRAIPELDLVENATGARSLLVILAMLGERFRLDGRDGLRQRPLEAALEVLRIAGVSVTGGRLPLAVDAGKGHFPDPVLVSGASTTQAATGCMLGLGLRATLDRAGLRQRIKQRLGVGRRPLERSVQVINPSAKGYLKLTAEVMGRFGHQVQDATHGADLVFRIGPRSTHEGTYEVPADPSARTFPLVLAAMHGITSSGVLPSPDDDPHPEWAVQGDVEAILGGGPDGRTVVLPDLAARPDAVPALGVLAATVPHPVLIRGVPALRLKESDRLAGLARGLAALGVAVEEHDDGLAITGQLQPGAPDADPVEVPCPEDHRMVMAFSLLGTLRPGGIVLPHATAVGKSWPGFGEWLERVAEVRVVAR